MLYGVRVAAEYAEALVADLVSVAVGAVEQVASPALADAREVGELVAEPGGDQDAAGGQCLPVRQGDLEAAVVASSDVSDGAADQVPAVAGHLVAAGRQQLRGWHAVARQEPLHVGGGCVAGRARVDHHDRAAGAGQDQGC